MYWEGHLTLAPLRWVMPVLWVSALASTMAWGTESGLLVLVVGSVGTDSVVGVLDGTST